MRYKLKFYLIIKRNYSVVFLEGTEKGKKKKPSVRIVDVEARI